MTRKSAAKLKIALSLFAATAAIICVEFVIQPAFWIRLFGAHADSQAMLLYRLIGALFGGLAAIAWLSRSAHPSESQEAMVRGLVVLNALLAIVAVAGALTGVYNQLAWGPALMFGAFAMTFARLVPPRVPVRAD